MDFRLLESSIQQPASQLVLDVLEQTVRRVCTELFTIIIIIALRSHRIQGILVRNVQCKGGRVHSNIDDFESEPPAARHYCEICWHT